MPEKLEVLITAEDRASSVLQSVGDVAKTALGVAIGQAVIPALKGMADGLVSVVGEASSAQEVQAQLAAVLQSTGGAAGVTADMANDLANSLSGVTKFEDDTILSGENMLLTFTNIGKGRLPMATEAMLNMSQATGQDLQSSAVQLGKALNDPVAGISSLTRVGVTFTAQQKEQIAAMVEAGDVAGAQTLILQELQREFGGAAKAAGRRSVAR
jgi:phage-related minor tail protein